MQWPMLSVKNQKTETQTAFGGYNRNLQIPEGEFSEMENMTSDHAPLLAPRKRRGVFVTVQSPQGLIAKDALCWVDGSAFVMNGFAVEMGLSTDPQDCPKQLLSMGAYVIVMPDKKYINTADLEDRGSMEAFFTTQAPVSFTLCLEDGTDCVPDYCQSAQPEKPANMALWVDTSAKPNTLKQWSESSAMWVSIPTTYVRIASAGIGKAFDRYDGVFLKGLTGNLTDSATGEPLADTSDLAALEGSAVIWEKGDDYIVITGMLELTRSVSEPLTVSREVPAMDFILERENRLWGCRYGLNNEGQVVNEIYASKLGDFKNWNCFMGISTDSYSVSLGSDGPFTGAVNFGGYPLFWKETCVHKLFGDYPANFGIQTTACRGVQQGSGRSLAIVNEQLFYKARHAVCVYDGALPMEISRQLGEAVYTDAVGGAHAGKYYVSMQDASGAYHLFVYDTTVGMWHREDALRADAFCSCREELYCVEHGTGRILALMGSGTQAEEKVRWHLQTGPMGLGLHRRRYISRLMLRLGMEPGARLQAAVRYDSLGGWENAGSVTGMGLGSVSFSIRPRRCDHFQLRLEGEGDVRIYSWTKTVSQGSDRV